MREKQEKKPLASLPSLCRWGYLPWNFLMCVIINFRFSRLLYLGILLLTSWKHLTLYSPWSPEHWGVPSGLPPTLVTNDTVWASTVPCTKTALLFQCQKWATLAVRELCWRLPPQSLVFSVPGAIHGRSSVTGWDCLWEPVGSSWVAVMLQWPCFQDSQGF